MFTFASDAFGFRTPYYYAAEDGKKLQNPGAFPHNISNLLGYIPLIGTIIGIAKLRLSYRTAFLTESTESYLKAYRFRATVELFSIGCVFIIPDLLISVGRFLSIERRESVSSPS